MRRSLACVICAAVLFVSSGCSVWRADARVAYWQKQADQHLPVGTTLDDAGSFFAAHGLKLSCCMSGPDIVNAYSATDRDVGRFVFTEYSVLIVVDVSSSQTVARVRVLRIGVGL